MQGGGVIAVASVGEHGLTVYMNPKRMCNNCLLGSF